MTIRDTVSERIEVAMEKVEITKLEISCGGGAGVPIRFEIGTGTEMHTGDKSTVTHKY